MSAVRDGPITPFFQSVSFSGNVALADLGEMAVSEAMCAAMPHAPSGSCVCWGIPFDIDRVAVLVDRPVLVEFSPLSAQWLVIMHTSDIAPLSPAGDFCSPMRGEGQLNEHVADYVMLYADGSEARSGIRRRHQIGMFERRWGENCFQSVAHHKPHPLRASHEQLRAGWGQTQTRVNTADAFPWTNWLWSWQNPHPEKQIVGVRFEPLSGRIVVSALSAGRASEQPFRWRARRKAVLNLPQGDAFAPDLDEHGLLAQVQLDLGNVISAQPRLYYPNNVWADSYNNQVPTKVDLQILIEYTSHVDALFHLPDGQKISVSQVENQDHTLRIQHVPAAARRIRLQVKEKGTNRCVAVKLHIHGPWGEYLAPVNRHRIINTAWFEDYSVDFGHQSLHSCTYIPGETVIDLPLGPVYVEISKGFEIRPVRQVIEVAPSTQEITIQIETVLPWREKGWISADTHVHFLTPMSALLEGAAEGVNVVNLLASQWGELMTNVGDFDGKMTWGSREAGGDGEYLVRVGTENRQHVLGHISLLGYDGQIIAPMTTGGPDESALGDPLENLLTEWARQCHKQGGLVVLPHFPNPRAEHAASIVAGDIDALEMTSWGNLYGGIDPYSLSDWYRYLNCGYLVAAVGGTDKMSANTAVGTVRTYAHLDPDQLFTYSAWMDAVKRAETFVTYGPLLEFAVDGQPMGSQIEMTSSGGTVDVTWQAASVTVPMSRVELIVNGEIRESQAVSGDQAAGHWRTKIEKSAWLALLIRGHYSDKPEILAAHSSPVMVLVEGSPMMAAADAVTILEQIEGAIAYLDTIGTRQDDLVYKRMRLVLESAHRQLHNRMHQHGFYHDHTPVTDHPEHH